MLIRFIDRVPLLNHTHASYCWLCTSNIPLHPFLPYIYIYIYMYIYIYYTQPDSCRWRNNPWISISCFSLHWAFLRKTAMLAAPPSIPGHLSLWETRNPFAAWENPLEDVEDVRVCHWVFWKGSIMGQSLRPRPQFQWQCQIWLVECTCFATSALITGWLVEVSLGASCRVLSPFVKQRFSQTHLRSSHMRCIPYRPYLVRWFSHLLQVSCRISWFWSTDHKAWLRRPVRLKKGAVFFQQVLLVLRLWECWVRWKFLPQTTSTQESLCGSFWNPYCAGCVPVGGNLEAMEMKKRFCWKTLCFASSFRERM